MTGRDATTFAQKLERELTAERDAWHAIAEKLAFVGSHSISCDLMGLDRRATCTCGFGEALAKFNAMGKPGGGTNKNK